MSKGHPMLTLLFGVVLFVCLIATGTVGILRHIITEEAISNMVLDIDTHVLVEQLEIYEMLTEAIDEDLVQAFGITPEVISEFLGRESIREFVADNAAEMVDHFINYGQARITITQDEVMRLVRDNVPYIEAQFGLSIPEEVFEVVEHVLEQSDIPDSIAIDVPEPDVGFDIDSYRWILMPGTFTMLMAICMVITGLIALINIRRFRIAFFGTGVATLSSGLVFLMIGGMLPVVIPIFVGDAMLRGLITSLLTGARAAVNIVGGFMLAAGVLFMVLYGISSVVKREPY